MFGLSVFDGHFVHDYFPVFELYVPDGHFVHSDKPLEDPYDPFGHVVHDSAPSDEYVPVEHNLQVVDDVAPVASE